MTTRALPQLIYQSTSSLTSPFVTSEQARDVDYAIAVITIESISGAPSTATISPKFQLWHSIVGGNQEEVNSGGSGMDPANSWMTLAASSNPFLLPDGDWPTSLDISTATLTAPVQVARTIRGGAPWRLSVPFVFTGGTSPSARMSVIIYNRERFVGGFDRVDSGA